MNLREVLDDLLEISVVGSFTSVGYAARRRLFGWTDPPADMLAGRTVAITGPTSGLGRAAAFSLAGLGARMLLLGRNPDRLAELAAELAQRSGVDRSVPIVVDMASLESVASAVERIGESENHVDVLVDNAGAIFAERTESPDGIEATLATMVVGPFALISGLLPLLRVAPGGGRVISVTSGGMYSQALPLDDLQWENEPYSGSRAYARAKRAQVALVREWARRTPGNEVTFSTMHPGWADTPGLADQLPGFHRLMQPILRTAEEGVDTVVWLATAPDPSGRDGQLFLDRRARPFDRVPGTRLVPAERRRLWDLIVALAGIADPAPSGG